MFEKANPEPVWPVAISTPPSPVAYQPSIPLGPSPPPSPIPDSDAPPTPVGVPADAQVPSPPGETGNESSPVVLTQPDPEAQAVLQAASQRWGSRRINAQAIGGAIFSLGFAGLGAILGRLLARGRPSGSGSPPVA